MYLCRGKSICHNDFYILLHCRISNGFWPFIISVIRLRALIDIRAIFFLFYIFSSHDVLRNFDERIQAASHKIYLLTKLKCRESENYTRTFFFVAQSVGAPSRHIIFLFPVGSSSFSIIKIRTPCPTDYESIRVMMSAVAVFAQSNRYIIISSRSLTLSQYVSISRTHIHDIRAHRCRLHNIVKLII